MAEYKVRAPDGHIVTLRGPDGASNEEIVAQAQRLYQPGGGAGGDEEPRGVLGTIKDYTVDALKAVPRSLELGAEHLGGFAGDLGESMNAGLDYLTGAITGEDSTYFTDTSKKYGAHIPTSESIAAQREKLTGKYDEPQYMPGKFIQSIGEQVLPSLAMGPASPGALAPTGVRAAAKTAALRSAAGKAQIASIVGAGAGEEAAAEGAEALGADPNDPTARMVGGFMGGGIGGARAASRIEKAARSNVNTNLKAASQRAYAKLENAPFTLANFAYMKLPMQMQLALGKHIRTVLDSGPNYLGPEIAKKTYQILGNRLDNARPMRMSELLGLHQYLGNIEYVKGKGGDYVAAQIARGEIRNFMQGIGLSKPLTQALGNWAMAMKVQDIEKALEVALRRAAVSGTGANEINTMRQEIRKIVDHAGRISGYPPNVKEQMIRVIEGTYLENAARWVGKIAAPSGLHGVTAAVIITQLAHSPLFLGLAGTGYAAKKLGDYLTHKEITRIVHMLQESAPVNNGVRSMNLNLRQIAADTGGLRGEIAGTLGGYMSSQSVMDNPSGIPLQ